MQFKNICGNAKGTEFSDPLTSDEQNDSTVVEIRIGTLQKNPSLSYDTAPPTVMHFYWTLQLFRSK